MGRQHGYKRQAGKTGRGDRIGDTSQGPKGNEFGCVCVEAEKIGDFMGGVFWGILYKCTQALLLGCGEGNKLEEYQTLLLIIKK